MWIGLRKLGPYLLVLLLLALLALAADQLWPSEGPEPEAEGSELDTQEIPPLQDDTTKPDLNEPDTLRMESMDTAANAQALPAGNYGQEEQAQEVRFTVVIGSFPSREKAESWMSRHPGGDTIVYAVEVNSYRVLGGFFADLQQAQQYQISIRVDHPEAWITRM